MRNKVRSLRIYLVNRFIFKPEQVLVIAKSQKDAEIITNKRYGHSQSHVVNVRLKRYQTFVLDPAQ